ncbi:MAG: hypothetical protein HY907_11305 [Deltaproteobacteria bacterium]|nr:hypothetical protein [Deltaproteobacteria bacterium]
MKTKYTARGPKGAVRRPLVCRTSDLDFDFGAPLLPDGPALGNRWRVEHVEEERGMRADIYRALGLA